MNIVRELEGVYLNMGEINFEGKTNDSNFYKQSDRM